MAKTDWQIRLGTFDSSGMGTSFAVVNFTVQTDMKSSVHWMAPVGQFVDTITPALIHQAVSADVEEYGGLTFPWLMPYLTPNMITYIDTNVFDGKRSAIVTVKSKYRRTGTFKFYNATASWDPESGDPVGIGYANVPINFIKAVETG